MGGRMIITASKRAYMAYTGRTDLNITYFPWPRKVMFDDWGQGRGTVPLSWRELILSFTSRRIHDSIDILFGAIFIAVALAALIAKIDNLDLEVLRSEGIKQVTVALMAFVRN